MRRCLSMLALASLIFVSTGSLAGDPRLEPADDAAFDRAATAHLLERAGFGGTPAEIGRLAALGREGAVRHLVYFEDVPEVELPPFEHSGIFDPGLDPFPPSRPATTKLAAETGEALGIKVRTGGNRPLQPVVN